MAQEGMLCMHSIQRIVAQGGHEYTPDKYAPVPTSITQLPVSTTALDTLIAAVAAGSAFWLLSYLEAASGKNLLAVLRHTGRLKEIKHAGMRCWHLR